jgi:ABC transport system ATP-binding/permease protein
MTLHVRILAPSGEVVRDLSVAHFPARLGRDPASEVAIDDTRFPMVSALHARIDLTPHGPVLIHQSRKNQTLLNDRPLDHPAVLKPGDRIGLGHTGPTVEVVAIEVRADRPDHDFEATIAPTPIEMAALRRAVTVLPPVPVGGGGILGREPESMFHLPHPAVSRRHAAIAVHDGQVILSDLDSANGTFLNGKRLARSAALKPGDWIDVGPYSLVFDGRALSGRTRSDNIELVARDLTRVVWDRTTGKRLTLLHGISLVVRPREFVCLLGPSGSGKSTLLNLLSGRVEPTGGAVLVNGLDLYAHFEALKQDIAVVPQRDVLHESLAIETALRYTAELRLPPDTGLGEVFQTVNETLAVVRLTQRRATLIRHLSGGQMKRASLANEILCKPTLLFLDEVTSGLDEETDRDMMELFGQLANDGKTVVCITHNLANVEATCHLVVILTEGGRMAFVGPPDAAKRYFGVTRLGDVYRMLAGRPAEEWEARFRGSPEYTEYVVSRLPNRVEEPAREAPRPDERHRPAAVRQARVLTRRYVSVWCGDVLALLAMLGQCLLVAVLLGLVFSDLPGVDLPGERAVRTANLFFLLNVSCFWLGCNNAAKELVRERPIYFRERDINLRTDSYYVSKYLVLLAIGLIQVTLLFGIVRPWCDPDGPAGAQWLVLAALMAAGTALGLLISACSPTEEVASALVPVAVIPQIILAGVIAPLTGIGKLLGYGLITCFWGRRALEGLLPESTVTWLGREELSPWPQLGVVLVHAGAFITVTVVILWYQARLQKLMSRLGR